MVSQPVVIIGGGAAGMLAAGRAGELGVKVLLFEKNQMLGRKIRITGKGRCNVTNSGSIEEIIRNFPSQGKFLYSSLNKLSNIDLTKLIESLGLPLKVERGGRVFPVSDRASDVVQALDLYLKRAKVEVRLGESVQVITVQDNRVTGIKTDRAVYSCKSVIIATGGLSYPATGSTGDGFRWARELGHKIVPLRPALVPLNTKEHWVKEVQGLALKNVKASLYKGEKLLGEEFGEMLFTHFGVSGPIILTLSRLVVTGKAGGEQLRLKINLKPALSQEVLDKRLQKDFLKYQRKQLKNALDELLPKNLIPIVIRLSGIEEDRFVHQITKEERMSLLQQLTALTLTINGPRSIDEAIVTAGGVSLKEIDPKSMESKIIEGLYFTGEVLDIDGFTGGYNLQAAFSTGYTAGEHAASNNLE